jgi:beta-glucanase (GH16 family)
MKRLTSLLLALLILAPVAFAADPAPKPLLDLGGPSIEKRIAASPQASASRTDAGLSINIAAGKEGYPGITLTPEGGLWDLSAYGHLEAVITNPSDKPLSVNLRVDDDGDWKTEPWNAESLTLKPNATATLKLIFGYSYGFKPAHKLNAARVARVLIFTGKTDAPRTFVLTSLTAAGAAGEKPPVDPNSIRTVPPDGVLVGAGVSIDPAKQLTLPKGAAATTQPSGPLTLTFPPTGGDATLKPAVGRWNLRDWLDARITIRNAGQAPFTPRARLDSGGRTDTITAPEPLAPGATTELVVPFASAHIWDGSDKQSGSHFASSHAAAVTVGVDKGSAERVVEIQQVRCTLPPPEALPDWLGKRPPVEGDWAITFNDDFDGDAIDATHWSFYGENYWDKQTTHFSKDNTIIGGGVVRLRLERKPGFHNDDPKRFKSNYATGFLETRGKWTQKYGYFESRMKVPTAPGLWPAFWMMPDRGKDAPNAGDTGHGGMEFDIMEHLTRWGPMRYNIAMHWDGYGKDHKSIGTEGAYCRPDKDGFITAGLLWLPGKAVYYCNGHEVARWENERVSSVPEQMMFTLPAGGWDNDALDDAKLPGDFIIDYVRVWQRADLK